MARYSEALGLPPVLVLGVGCCPFWGGWGCFLACFKYIVVFSESTIFYEYAE